jgi:hypothetical protein
MYCIDDEELARKLIESYIKKLDFLELAGSFQKTLEAIAVQKRSALMVF